ncbi:lipase family protein [Vibrio parahaemolyticus]|uniref:lipase family protein n=1 Tax=Vibrio parahaemolyticus TaxID=670 RepID=UPI00084B1ABC|nr:lipase family protein [Vibrio parahaemolyticus]MBE4411810.1 lipase family protein [Vibrio parahaemolyticus]MCX8813504.1 lipase family protein [Vibrio parahaemolyticus]MCX8836493.1 lipase family protein [Vibrio parahaemolyticus]MCX8910522.1 lipase family protein [Vibrio parahaemolyticus]MDF4573305.1 lipase family protein [Vibrio parahaemolyticus]
MSEISPKQASYLALAAYSIKQNLEDLEVPLALRNDFSFKDMITGTSGGFFFRPETGFALLGKGKSQRYKNDLVLAFRGTAGLADGITDLTCSGKGTDTGETVHSGFQTTFYSMRKGLTRFLRDNPVTANGTIHCVGHSLGGALATLVANWIYASPEFKGRVNLYTFGSPRVGMKSFSINSSSRISTHFRCVNGADPVTKAPVWPFYHVPYDGSEYILNRAQGLFPSAHFMAEYSSYTQTATWDSLGFQKASSTFKRVVLNYENRLQATPSADWADKISAALLTLLVDGGAAASVFALQNVGSAIATIYDAIARSIVKISELSSEFSERVKGLLGHMLVFAGKGANIAIKFTYSFIRWVFELVLSKLNQAVKAALKTTF